MRQCRALALLVAGACAKAPTPPAAQHAAQPAGHSSTLALQNDGRVLYVVNPDADSVSVLDLEQHSLRQEILLAATAPSVDANGNYFPSVAPRSLALSPDGKTLYVSGARANTLYALDTASGQVAQVAVDSEPVGVLTDGASVWVACAQDATVLRIDTATLQVVARAKVPSKPWALAWGTHARTLWVSHLLGPGISGLDPNSLQPQGSLPLPGVAPRGDRRLAHGVARGLYDLQLRPGGHELWAVHTLLGTDTPQPQLDFESTAFPALALFDTELSSPPVTLSTDASSLPGVDGAFADVVSGAHAVAFTRDGNLLLMVDTFSEDILLIDAQRRVQVGLVRPLPGQMPEGIALSQNETQVFVDERNSGDVAVFDFNRSSLQLTLQARLPRLAQDPMPESLRQGQQLFYSANSDATPITSDHWIACATCHLEGRSDAVTWLFTQGPRDTPSNAGGLLGTGFLFRTADRTEVQDYWRTINTEQGGRFSPTQQAALLDALASYVNHAIPLPPPPSLDANAVIRGAALFNRSDVGCNSCHSGAHHTDSGAGNPNLDLAGPVLLHDVGTCVVSGLRPDTAHTDIAGQPRSACEFDTPSLQGLADSAPYLHDGSAATLLDLLTRPGAHAAGAAGLSPQDQQDLLTFLQSL